VRDIRAAIKPQLLPTPPELKLYLPPQFREGAEEQRGVVDVDVGKEGFGADDGKMNDGGSEGGEMDGEGDSMVGATRWQKDAARKKKELRSEEKQKPMGGGEDAGKAEGGTAKEGAKVEKPLSRAERRRKIKEEILATGEGEGFKGYKRRMW
jgi:hypothetical protein